MAKRSIDTAGARQISKDITGRRELKELTEKDRAKLGQWIVRIALGLELSFE